MSYSAEITTTKRQSAWSHKWYDRIYGPARALGRRTDLGFMVAESHSRSADSTMVKDARKKRQIKGTLRVGETRGNFKGEIY